MGAPLGRSGGSIFTPDCTSESAKHSSGGFCGTRWWVPRQQARVSFFFLKNSKIEEVNFDGCLEALNEKFDHDKDWKTLKLACPL